MAGRECRRCQHCLLRAGSAAMAAPCEMRIGLGQASVYVEVDVDCGCDLFVGRLPDSGAWDDEQRLALVRAAQTMASETGHGVRECFLELVRIVRDFKAERSAA
ncbi:MAG: hypothetical protein IKE22_14230 [Atopobiaceae bacterium]|nr:hypothetical protein [Atopobiaceae bacterium]